MRSTADAERESGSVRYPWAWRKPGGIREQQLRRAPLCESCSTPGQVVAATEVDHVDGDRTNHRPSNLRSLCKSCHSARTWRDQGPGRRRHVEGRTHA